MVSYLVYILLACANTNAYTFSSSIPVKSLGALTKTASETIVDEGTLQDLLEGLLNGHLTTGRGIGSDLNLGNLSSGISFCRHFDYSLIWGRRPRCWEEKERCRVQVMSSIALIRQNVDSLESREFEFECWNEDRRSWP